MLIRTQNVNQPDLAFLKETVVRKLLMVAAFGVYSLLRLPLYAQQIDAAFGVSTLVAPSSSSASGDHAAQTISGGAYPGFSGDFLLRHAFGVGGELYWRASQSIYQGFQPFRPILWDFNGVWAPPLGRSAAAELEGGIGAQSVRFYNSDFLCGFAGCTNYTSSNHFMGHFGGGIRFYVHGNLFVRPEAHVYLVHNNIEFSSSHEERFGVSIGYSLNRER